MRSDATAAAALAAGVIGSCLLISCGGVRAADLFAVTRSGSTPHAALTIVIDEEGGARCNGAPARRIEDAQLVRARGIQEELRSPASRGLSLQPRPGSVFSYSVRDENGTVRFADNSAGQPRALHELALLVAELARGVCGLPE
jgi:hypothetical protein